MCQSLFTALLRHCFLRPIVYFLKRYDVQFEYMVLQFSISLLLKAYQFKILVLIQCNLLTGNGNKTFISIKTLRHNSVGKHFGFLQVCWRKCHVSESVSVSQELSALMSGRVSMSASAASPVVLSLCCLCSRPHRACSGLHTPWELPPRGITGCGMMDVSEKGR